MSRVSRRGGRHTVLQGRAPAHTCTCMHTAHHAHATHQALWDENEGVRDKRNFLLMPQNKEQDQILLERPQEPTYPKAYN